MRHHRRRNGDLDMAALALRDCLQVRDGIVEIAQHPLGDDLEPDGVLRQLDPAGGAVEQLQPRRLLELLDRGGERGLRLEKTVRRQRE